METVKYLLGQYITFSFAFQHKGIGFDWIIFSFTFENIKNYLWKNAKCYRYNKGELGSFSSFNIAFQWNALWLSDQYLATIIKDLAQDLAQVFGPSYVY